ncbi:hypothetical protein [Streptomyces nigrescens]|uniref:hypothetical protein n=1 Tax=Streptomyces nigrescens TaxID=1920 RepID=UPI0036F6FA2E
MDELVIALVAAVFGLAGTVLGAVVAARATKAGAEKNAETVRRQVEDQATAEHSHWLRQQRLNTYEGFLEAWDECLRLTQASSDACNGDLANVDLLREAAGRMAGRARRIALLGPPEVTQAAEDLAETMQQDVDASAEFMQATEVGLSALGESPVDVAAVQAATEDFEERGQQLQDLLTGVSESRETVDGHPLLAEYLESVDRYGAASQAAVRDLQANSNQLSELVDQASALVHLLTHNQAARELSRKQFTVAARKALSTRPLPEK